MKVRGSLGEQQPHFLFERERERNSITLKFHTYVDISGAYSATRWRYSHKHNSPFPYSAIRNLSMGTKESYTLTKSFEQFCSRLKVSKANFSAQPWSPRSCHCTTEFGGYGESGKPGDLIISATVPLACWVYLVFARHKENKRLFLHVYYWIHCTIISMNVLRKLSPVPKPPELGAL